MTVTHLCLFELLLVLAPRGDDGWLPSYDAHFIVIVVGFLVTWTLVLLLEVRTVTQSQEHHV